MSATIFAAKLKSKSRFLAKDGPPPIIFQGQEKSAAAYAAHQSRFI
jgi:hypothetical protein